MLTNSAQEGSFSTFPAYGTSKLAATSLTYELARRLKVGGGCVTSPPLRRRCAFVGGLRAQVRATRAAGQGRHSSCGALRRFAPPWQRSVGQHVRSRVVFSFAQAEGANGISVQVCTPGMVREPTLAPTAGAQAPHLRREREKSRLCL